MLSCYNVLYKGLQGRAFGAPSLTARTSYRKVA